MLRLAQALKQARLKKFAIPAFNFDNWIMAYGIAQAAEQLKAPVILMISEKSVATIGGIDVAKAIFDNVRERINQSQIFFQYDHGHDLDLCRQWINQKIDSVMVDWSKQDLHQNINTTKTMANLAHANNVCIEGEIGHVGGKAGPHGDDSILTNPAEAYLFAETTQVDALAIAAGTSHGVYRAKPVLNFDLIKTIRDNCQTPLVLHGCSGVPIVQIKTAIKSGISKVNIGTDLKIVYLDTMRKWLAAHPNSHDVRQMTDDLIAAIKAATMDWIIKCGANNQAIAI